MKKDDNNVTTSTPRESRELTPFERHAEGRAKAAYMMKMFHETAALVKRLDDLREFEDDLPVPLELLEEMADEAIIGLAQDLEARFGISA